MVRHAAAYLRRCKYDTPPLAVVLGSGLDSIMQQARVDLEVRYADIPGLPSLPGATVAGHAGRLAYCEIAGVPVLVLRGRWHYYEGYAMEEVTRYVRVLHALGVEHLVLTNASGGVNPSFQPGDLMLITDHINLMPNPLIGPNDDTLGPRFPTMHAAYDPEGLELARLAAKHTGVKLHEGCYLGTTGPAYETPHEYHFYHTVGADAVGMSTVPEVIVANHCGVKVLAFSMISNVGGLHHHVALSHEEVQAVGAQASDNLARLLLEILPQL